MHRPLVSVAAALALGLLAGFAWHAAPAAGLIVALLLGAGALGLLRAGRPRWAFAATLAAVAAAGAGYAGARSAEGRGRCLASLLAVEPQLLHVRGFVVDRPLEQLQPPRRQEPPRLLTRFTLEVTEVRTAAAHPAPGRLRVLLEAPANGLNYGDEVEATLEARRAPAAGNPGEYDYARYLARKGISGVATIPDGGLRPTGRVRAFPGLRPVYALKHRLLQLLDARMPDRAARIIKCLVLGEPATLTDEQLRAFRETGSLHFLAISGQHISLIAVCAWGALALLGLRHRLAAVIVFLVVLFYGVLAGLEPSVLRAVIMCHILCGAFVFLRKPDLASGIALALIAVLLLDPADLYNAGMQLSFIAVLGICLFALPLERALFGVPDDLDRVQAPAERRAFRHAARWALQKAVCVSLAAWLATVPLLAQHFQMITPLAPLASVALFPPVTLALMAGLPGVLLAPAVPLLAQPLLAVSAAGAQATDWACGKLAAIPHAALYVPPPGWALVALCYALFLALAYRQRLGLTRWRVAACLLAVPLLYLGVAWRPAAPAHLRVHALSVGRGNCILLRLPGGRNLLFDAGSAGISAVGARTIAPALWAVGVRRLDLVILSHGDGDHVSGFAELARRIPVGRLALTDAFERHVEPKFLAAIRAAEVPIVRIGAGDRIGGLPGVEVEVLWPPRDLPMTKCTGNELSALLRVSSADGSVLLTGDFGRRAAGLLLAERPDLHADILQAPHHGFADPAAAALAEAVHPRLALVPGGRQAAAAPLYAAHAERLLTTDECGMISVQLNAGALTVETYR